MTEPQFLVLAGLICLAPHAYPVVGFALGLGYIILAVCIKLGWT